jgi:hypothetical protein
MSLTISIEQLDLICNVSIVLDAAPESISYPCIWFATPLGCVNLDFDKKEIQLIDFRDVSQKYFALMGLGSMNKMEVVDYYSKNDSVL